MIPKLIHHLWPGQDAFRPEFHRFRTSFVQYHPDWDFRFWRTDLGPGTSEEVRAVLDDPRYTVVVKSDVARFELLRLYGGIYVDTDMECLRPFDPLLDAAFFCGRESEDVLCPSVMGCVPGHPLCEAVVRAALERLREAGPERANTAPNEVTGPALLTQVAAGRDDVRILEPAAFYPVVWWETGRLHETAAGAFAKHWWNGTTAAGWTQQQRFGDPAQPSPPGGPVKYDLGGTGLHPGWLSVNLVPGADRQCDILALDVLHPADGEVDEFLLEHTLEHVPVTRYVTFLRDLYRKLKPGGSVTVVQTDAESAIRDYVDGRLSFRSMRTLLFTPEDRVRDNPLMAHHNMWSAEELARDFRAVGFEAHTFDAGTWGFDTHDPLYDEELVRDHGKPVRNLGVKATKP